MDREQEAEQPLQVKPVSPQNDMNSYPRNITSDNHSDGNSSANNMEDGEDSPAESRMKQLKNNRERALAISSNVFSVVALVLSVIAIICYKQAADELKTARENRG